MRRFHKIWNWKCRFSPLKIFRNWHKYVGIGGTWAWYWEERKRVKIYDNIVQLQHARNKQLQFEVGLWRWENYNWENTGEQEHELRMESYQVKDFHTCRFSKCEEYLYRKQPQDPSHWFLTSQIVQVPLKHPHSYHVVSSGSGCGNLLYIINLQMRDTLYKCRLFSFS